MWQQLITNTRRLTLIGECLPRIDDQSEILAYTRKARTVRSANKVSYFASQSNMPMKKPNTLTSKLIQDRVKRA